jgi:hypothetical protein
MSSYLPRSDADRFWSAVTAATIVALVWLILAVGPESGMQLHANAFSGHPSDTPKPAAAAAVPERAPVRAHVSDDRRRHVAKS